MLLFDPKSLPENMENVVTGEVSELIYLGKARKYVIRVVDTQITALQQITDSGRATFNIGDVVAVHWNAMDAVTIADSAPSLTASNFATAPEARGSLLSDCGALERPSR